MGERWHAVIGQQLRCGPEPNLCSFTSLVSFNTFNTTPALPHQAELDAEAALRSEAGRRFAYFEDLPPWYCPANEVRLIPGWGLAGYSTGRLEIAVLAAMNPLALAKWPTRLSCWWVAIAVLATPVSSSAAALHLPQVTHPLLHPRFDPHTGGHDPRV